MYIYMYGTYVIPYISMIYLSGRSRHEINCYEPGCEAWVRGQERISCCTWRINELNCKTMDREE